MTDSRTSSVGKWMAGIFAAVIGGVLIWLITNTVLPRWFAHTPPPPPDKTHVECTSNPATVAPNGVAEITVKVTRDDEPVEGATVQVHLPESASTPSRTASGTTYSGGVFRISWTAPSPSAAGYVFPAEVDLHGVRTAKGEMEGHYRTNCQILVSR